MFVIAQSLMLSIAKGLLEEEEQQREEERQHYMARTCPQVSMPRTLQELQVLDPLGLKSSWWAYV